MPRKGSKRKKSRTHVKPTNATDPNAPKVPKTFVVKSGTVGNSVSALTRDVRRVLEPNTASRLRERKANRLRDYVSMSGPLGVTHLVVFSQPSSSSLTLPSASGSAATNAKDKEGTAAARAERSLIDGTTTLNLRLIRLPRGPTLSFKVLRYSLAQDVLRAARRPRAIGREFAEGPLLILSGFGGEDKQLKLMTTVFQNLFPPIHVQTMPLSSARRVVLLSYNPVTHTIDFRHFLISVRPVGVSKPIRKLIAGSSNNKIGAGSGLLSSSGPSAVPFARKRAAAGSAESGTEDDDDDVDGGRGWQIKSVGGGAGVAGKGKGIVDLSRASDISDYILRHEGMGFVTSDSEMSDMSDVGEGSVNGGSDSELDEKRGKVRLASDYVGRGNRGKAVRGDKRAIRLVELGPRMELGLFKVEEGVGEGEVLFHEMVHKSTAEAASLAKQHAARRKLQAERRAEQERNVAAKKAAKAAENKSKDKVAAGDHEDEDGDDSEDENALVDDGFDYEAEHGLAVPDGDEDGDDDDEELEGSSGDEAGSASGLGDDSQMAVESDADDSDSQDEGQMLDQDEEEEEYSDDDSDMSPIPIGDAEFLSSGDDEDVVAPPAKRSKPTTGSKKSSSAMSFSHKGFSKAAEPRAAKMPRGLAAQRGPTKRQQKMDKEREDKGAKKGGVKVQGRARFEDFEKDEGGTGGGSKSRDGGGRGGRGGARGRGGRGKSRGGRGGRK